MKKSNADISVRQHPSVGLQWTPDKSGIAVDWSQLPASDHFFVATHFNLKSTPAGIKMLFGVKSSFDETSKTFDLAVEIHMPAPEAYFSLYRNVFKEVSGNGKITFYESVKGALNKRIESEPSDSHETNGIGLPTNRGSSFRIFPANFVGIAFTGHQAMIEFFEIPPDLLHFFRIGREARPGAGVKPVISIIIDSMLLWSLLEKCKTVFQSEKMEGVENGI